MYRSIARDDNKPQKCISLGLLDILVSFAINKTQSCLDIIQCACISN